MTEVEVVINQDGVTCNDDSGKTYEIEYKSQKTGPDNCGEIVLYEPGTKHRARIFDGKALIL